MCQDIKDQFDLAALGIIVHNLDRAEDSTSPEWMRVVESYTELAWCEHVEDAEKKLPILQIGEKEWVSGDDVKVKLEGMINDVTITDV